MSPPKSRKSLPAGVVAALTKEILRWDGRYPLHWNPELTDALRDPTVFKTFLTLHAVVWGPSPELAKTAPPPPIPKGEADRR